MFRVSKAMLIAIAGLASLSDLGGPCVSAQGYYDKGGYVQPEGDYVQPEGRYGDGRRAELYGYSVCHNPIRATGIGYPFGIGSRNSAIKAWQREAWSYYGRDFLWSRAEEPNIQCAPYLATIRCTASARPCS
jgi:hypothetical protein